MYVRRGLGTSFNGTDLYTRFQREVFELRQRPDYTEALERDFTIHFIRHAMDAGDVQTVQALYSVVFGAIESLERVGEGNSPAALEWQAAALAITNWLAGRTMSTVPEGVATAATATEAFTQGEAYASLLPGYREDVAQREAETELGQALTQLARDLVARGMSWDDAERVAQRVLSLIAAGMSTDRAVSQVAQEWSLDPGAFRPVVAVAPGVTVTRVADVSPRVAAAGAGAAAKAGNGNGVAVAQAGLGGLGLPLLLGGGLLLFLTRRRRG